MSFVQSLKERDFVAQVTHEEELVDHISGGGQTAYVGFDPTADSLTAGHLVPVLALARWQQAGNKAIALIGGGTALVGDPTGKTDMRQMLTAEKIYENGERFKKQLSKFLELDDPKNGILLNNLDWLQKLNYIEFLRDIGPHFSVNRMLTAESVKLRLEKGLSFLEFNYAILQSYDFLELYRRHNCTVQLGGDDQWSNMLGGMELVRRLANGRAYCLTVPLLLNSDGSKMGKTEKGAVWLDPEKTSPYEFYQYWRNIEDASVIKVLKHMTFLSIDDIRELSHLKGSEINEAKRILAFELTKIVHNAKDARDAEETAKQLFQKDSAGHGNEPVFLMATSDFIQDMNIVDFLLASKVFPSKAEIRRLIQQGGLSVDGEKVTSFDFTVPNTPAEDSGWLVKKGKKHFYRVTLQ